MSDSINIFGIEPMDEAEDHPEDELCDDPLCECHDDCDRRDCEVCFEYAIDQAERISEGMER